MAFILRPLPPAHEETRNDTQMKAPTLAEIKANFAKVEKEYEAESTKNDPLVDGWRHMQNARGWK